MNIRSILLKIYLENCKWNSGEKFFQICSFVVLRQAPEKIILTILEMILNKPVKDFLYDKYMQKYCVWSRISISLAV